MVAPQDLAAMSSSMLELVEVLGPLKAAVDGYRADAIARGYSPTAAEAMAMDLHRAWIEAMFRTVGAPS